MTNVLRMATCKLCNPVALLVLLKADDWLFQWLRGEYGELPARHSRGFDKSTAEDTLTIIKHE